MSVVAKIDNLRKEYPGTLALDDVSLEIRSGEVLGLVGQNGSGKSTLIKLLGGVENPDGGTITLRGHRYRPTGVAAANAEGVGIVFQEQSLLPNLSVAENVFLGKAARLDGPGFLSLGGPPQGGPGAVGQGALRRLATSDRGRPHVRPTSDGRAGKVLALEEKSEAPLLILFDEPTSVLSQSEVQTLFTEIRRLRENSAVVFVSHRLDEILDVCDRIYVMSEGKKVAERTAAQSDTDELYRLMVGTDRASDYYLQASRAAATSRPRLVVDGLSSKGAFRDVSFTVNEGSVLGIAGLVGSGREEVCRSLCGAHPISSGSAALSGKRLRLRQPEDGPRAGVGFVPAERKIEGMLAGRSVHENFVVASGSTLQRRGLVDRKRERQVVLHWIDRLRVRTPSANARIEQLSGGNAQKVVLGKWMLSERLRLLILDHPTRGLDLGAKADVYEAIRDLTSQGLSVVLISDTLEETIGLSDQIIVMRDGVVTGRFDDTSEHLPASEQIVELMS